MSRQIKMLGLSVLAVFAVGVAVSASASAHAYFVCKETGTENRENHLCGAKTGSGKWSWAEVKGTETFEVESTGGTVKLEGEFFGAPSIMECSNFGFTGEIKAGGIGKGQYNANSSGCKLYLLDLYNKEQERSKVPLNACTVHLTFGVTDKVVMGQGFGPEEEMNSTEAEKRFGVIDFEGRECVLQGDVRFAEREIEILPSKQIAAGMVCSLPEAAVGKVEHEIVCSGTGSHLTLGGEPISFVTTETVKLSDGASWGIE